jgi:predicted alpha/beta hydrolase
MLHGVLFRGLEARRCSVVLLGALAAPQRYLQRTAAWLASRGYGVLTFDYRGVGESRLSGDPTTNLDDWGRDVAAAVATAREAFAPETLLVLGHSLGGMLLGTSGVGAEVDGALLVGATHGLPRYYRGASRLRVETAYRVLPRLARRLGGLPGWPFLLRAPVPRDVVVHWTRWGRRDFTRWNGESTANGFAALRGPLLGVTFADDDYAPVQAVDALLARFSRAGVRRLLIRPRERGEADIGHFGLFTGRPPTWAREELARWLAELEEAAAPAAP